MIGHQIFGVLIRLARDSGGVALVEGGDLGCGRGGDRGRYAALVHVVERLLHRPVGHRRIVELGLLHRVEPGRPRSVVLMLACRASGVWLPKVHARSGQEVPELEEALTNPTRWPRPIP